MKSPFEQFYKKYPGMRNRLKLLRTVVYFIAIYFSVIYLLPALLNLWPLGLKTKTALPLLIVLYVLLVTVDLERVFFLKACRIVFFFTFIFYTLPFWSKFLSNKLTPVCLAIAIVRSPIRLFSFYFFVKFLEVLILLFTTILDFWNLLIGLGWTNYLLTVLVFLFELCYYRKHHPRAFLWLTIQLTLNSTFKFFCFIIKTFWIIFGFECYALLILLSQQPIFFDEGEPNIYFWYLLSCLIFCALLAIAFWALSFLLLIELAEQKTFWAAFNWDLEIKRIRFFGKTYRDYLRYYSICDFHAITFFFLQRCYYFLEQINFYWRLPQRIIKWLVHKQTLAWTKFLIPYFHQIEKNSWPRCRILITLLGLKILRIVITWPFRKLYSIVRFFVLRYIFRKEQILNQVPLGLYLRAENFLFEKAKKLFIFLQLSITSLEEQQKKRCIKEHNRICQEIISLLQDYEERYNIFVEIINDLNDCFYQERKYLNLCILTLTNLKIDYENVRLPYKPFNGIQPKFFKKLITSLSEKYYLECWDSSSIGLKEINEKINIKLDMKYYLTRIIFELEQEIHFWIQVYWDIEWKILTELSWLEKLPCDVLIFADTQYNKKYKKRPDLLSKIQISKSALT